MNLKSIYAHIIYILIDLTGYKLDKEMFENIDFFKKLSKLKGN